MQAAFDQLKIALTSPPVLRISDPDRPYEVITDASNIAIGAVLLHDFSDGLQPVAYESRKLQGVEKNYTVHDKEMLAIVHAFKTWRCYLKGVDVTVRTDHKSLQYLRAQPNLNPRQIRWLDFLESNFYYTNTYKRGANNIADALTRPTAHAVAILVAHTHPLFTGLFTHGYKIYPFFRSAIHQQHTTANGHYFNKRIPRQPYLRAFRSRQNYEDVVVQLLLAEHGRRRAQVRVLLHHLPDHEIIPSVSSRTTTAVRSARATLATDHDGLRDRTAGRSQRKMTPSSWSLTDSRKWRTLSPANRKSRLSKLPNCSSPTSFDCTNCLPPLFQTETRNAHRISGATCGTNWAPNYNFPPPTTHRPMGRPNESTKLWNNSFGLPALTHRHGSNPFRCWNSRIITRPLPQPINPHFPELRTGPRG
ncbi:hypothetical protein CLOP_g15706 [Closterium sp. NIES-67]|nr:hypothetical protein CLOP_g15706 [Closterium sp. NIES-67]